MRKSLKRKFYLARLLLAGAVGLGVGACSKNNIAEPEQACPEKTEEQKIWIPAPDAPPPEAMIPPERPKLFIEQ